VVLESKEGISWTYSVKNGVLHRVKGDRHLLQTIKRRKDNWIGYIMHGNCIRKHITERKLEGMIKVAGR